MKKLTIVAAFLGIFTSSAMAEVYTFAKPRIGEEEAMNKCKLESFVSFRSIDPDPTYLKSKSLMFAHLTDKIFSVSAEYNGEYDSVAGMYLLRRTTFEMLAYYEMLENISSINKSNFKDKYYEFYATHCMHFYYEYGVDAFLDREAAYEYMHD